MNKFCVVFSFKGDVFGVLVTYFGNDMSTVMFLKNGQPVATRSVHFNSIVFKAANERFLSQKGTRRPVTVTTDD
jgi:hypothetical protein